jgi:hypothetical protein
VCAAGVADSEVKIHWPLTGSGKISGGEKMPYHYEVNFLFSVGLIQNQSTCWKVGLAIESIIVVVLTANGFLPSGSGTTINTLIPHITQNNTRACSGMYYSYWVITD